MLISAFPAALAAGTGSLDNFRKTQKYRQGQYSDVPSVHTFAANVRTAYEFGLMQGYGDSFGITSDITRLASIIIACRVHSIYMTGSNSIESQSGSTQEKYLRYANANGIFCDFDDVSVSATRAEFAKILSSCLPDSALHAMNVVDAGAIPDVAIDSYCSEDIYRLYRAGILNGSDASGTFYPSSPITRGAACAIATRMADTSLRKSVNLRTLGTNAETIYAKCAAAVAYIEVTDNSGFILGSGSGFFIDASGHFVTCFHVIEGAAGATVTTKDGVAHAVSGVYDYSVENDWAVLKVEGSGFSRLAPGTRSEYPSGAKVYAIGSPLGLSDTISDGIVTNPDRFYDGMSYIQTNASISEGSVVGA